MGDTLRQHLPTSPDRKFIDDGNGRDRLPIETTRVVSEGEGLILERLRHGSLLMGQKHSKDISR